MAISLRRKKKSTFAKAADGSMTLMEHLKDLRNRLFKAVLAVLAGVIVGIIFARPVQTFINAPYCDFFLEKWVAEGNPVADYQCEFNVGSPLDDFLLNLKIGLFVGIILAAPIWLYQLWAFIAPGLHRHERKYTYVFASVAAPLFLAGATLGYFVISKSLKFFLDLSAHYDLTTDLIGYFTFVTNVMLLFGAGFEFPLIIVLLNVIGIASAKRLLSWWRFAVFLVFLFCAVVTPTPDPFGMTALAIPMVGLYFAAVGFAFANDKRRARKTAHLDNLDPDVASTLEDYDDELDDVEPIAAVTADEEDAEDSEQSAPPQKRRTFDDDAT